MTTIEQSALLRAILADPADDTARLVYADWLQENGQGERAEFIRVQCRIAAIARDLQSEEDCWQPGCAECDERRRLRRRERELLPAHYRRWFPGPRGEAFPANTSRLLWGYGEPAVYPVEVTRGFVSGVTVPAADWLAHADALAWHPKQTVGCQWCRRGKGLYGEECPECEGTGHVPRTMPLTAQPITRVVLAQIRGVDVDALCARAREAVVGSTLSGVLAAEWPGITFEFRHHSEGPDEGRMG